MLSNLSVICGDKQDIFCADLAQRFELCAPLLSIMPWRKLSIDPFLCDGSRVESDRYELRAEAASELVSRLTPESWVWRLCSLLIDWDRELSKSSMRQAGEATSSSLLRALFGWKMLWGVSDRAESRSGSGLLAQSGCFGFGLMFWNSNLKLFYIWGINIYKNYHWCHVESGDLLSMI